MSKRIEPLGKSRNRDNFRRKLRNNRVPTAKKLRPSTKRQPEPRKTDIPQGYILVPSSIALILFNSLANFYLYTKTPLGGEDWSRFCAIMHDFVNRRRDVVPSKEFYDWAEWETANAIK